MIVFPLLAVPPPPLLAAAEEPDVAPADPADEAPGLLPLDLLLEPQAVAASETASSTAPALAAVEAVLINSPSPTWVWRAAWEILPRGARSTEEPPPQTGSTA